MKPLTQCERAGKKEDILLGKKLIAEGKVGTLILAGGVGSRLGFPGPKGAFVLPNLQKSLFQIHLEKIAPGLPVVIMTSGANHEQTVEYLKKQNYKGEIIMQKAPNGNGEALPLFAHSGLLHKWKKQGVEQLTTILIDNVLADPFDPNLCGFHKRENNEATLKCVSKPDPEEKMGVIEEENGKIKVIEYTEIPAAEKPKYTLGNTSLFSFSLDFVEKVADIDLPWHQGKTLEKYIFDFLDYADKASALLYPREQTFCPLKTPADIPLVERALM